MTFAPERRRAGADLAAVSLDDVSAGYHGSLVLERITCRIDRGELVGLVGPSGSGKTTLLRLLAGRLPPYAGEAKVLGRPVGRGRTLGIGYVPQLDRTDPTFPLTVEEVVLLGLSPALVGRPWNSRSERAAADRILERLGLEEIKRQRIGEISGGQLQRTYLARAMVANAEVLLLDEPTSGVDLASRREILRLLAELNASGMTIVLTTHDLNWVAAQLPRIICLQRVVLADGPPAEVLTSEVLERVFGTSMAVAEVAGRIMIADAEPIIGRPAQAAKET